MNHTDVLTSNPLLNLCFISWASAQLIKTLLDWIKHGSMSPERLVGSGGMPSAHSCMVSALVIGIARSEGFNSPLFALAAAFAGIVMYDAMGVRRAAGEQAKALNKMMFNFQDFTQLFLNHQDGNQDSNPENDCDNSEANPLLNCTGTNYYQQSKALKEYIGHTPMEVLAGALMGILIATVFPI